MKPHTNGSRVTGKGRARVLDIAGTFGFIGVLALVGGCRGDDFFDDLGAHGHHGGTGGVTGNAGSGGVLGNGGTGGAKGIGGRGGPTGSGGATGGGRVGDACGGLAGNLRPCAKGLFCEGILACAPDAGGTCQLQPDICEDIYAPVCGCDRQTYANDCIRRRAGVSKLSDGACSSGGSGGVSGGGGVFGSGGVSGAGGVSGSGGVSGAGGTTGLGRVGDACGGFIANARPCAKGLFCDGPFPELACVPDVGGTCEERPEICYDIFAPVCGCDCKTYGNDCQRLAAGVSKRANGACAPGNGC